MTHIGTGATRVSTKKAQSAEIELLTRDYLANGGEIQVTQTQRSDFKPTWAAYAAAAFEERDDGEDE